MYAHQEKIFHTFVYLLMFITYLYYLNTDTRVNFVGYNNDKLFRSELLEKETNTSVLGPLISAVVLGKEITNLTQQVVIRMTPTQVKCNLQP